MVPWVQRAYVSLQIPRSRAEELVVALCVAVEVGAASRLIQWVLLSDTVAIRGPLWADGRRLAP